MSSEVERVNKVLSDERVNPTLKYRKSISGEIKELYIVFIIFAFQQSSPTTFIDSSIVLVL